MTNDNASAVQLWASRKLLDTQGVVIPDPRTLQVHTAIDPEHGDYGYGGEIVITPLAEIQITNVDPPAYLLIELDQHFDIESFVEECITAAKNASQEDGGTDG